MTDDIAVETDLAIVTPLSETVENSDQSENNELTSDSSEIIKSSDKFENGEISNHSEIIENCDNLEIVKLSESFQNFNEFVAVEESDDTFLENSGAIENYDQPKTPIQEMISVESLKNTQISDTHTDVDPINQGDPALEGMGDSVVNSPDITDPSSLTLIEPDGDRSGDQSVMSSGHMSESQVENLDQSENVERTTNPHQSDQFVYDTTQQNKETVQDLNQTEDTYSGEKMSQSDTKVSLAVSDCSTRVESKGSSARSRSEVTDSKYVKKVDIVYQRDELPDRKDDEEDLNSNNPNELEIRSLEGNNSIQSFNENISEDFVSDAIQIGSTLKKIVPDVKSQRKVVRSEVKISEVMTQHFDPSLYDREKLKVTGVPLKKEENFPDPASSVLTQPRKPSIVRNLQTTHSESSPTGETSSAKPAQIESTPFPLIMKKTEISFKTTGNTTDMESFKIQGIDQGSRQNSVKKSVSKAGRVQNFRPVQRVRETIDEGSVLTFHTETQGIMGDFVTPIEVT